MKKQVRSQKLGALFEKAIEMALRVYAAKGWIVAEKVCPPMRVFGKRVIFLRNPFLDFVGVHCSTRRAVFIEAKYTTEPKLTMNGQLSRAQIESMERWRNAGAIVFILWCIAGKEAVLITAGDMLDVYKVRKHLRPTDGTPVHRFHQPYNKVPMAVRFYMTMIEQFGIRKEEE